MPACDDLLADLAKAKEARDDAQMEEDAKEEEARQVRAGNYNYNPNITVS